MAQQPNLILCVPPAQENAIAGEEHACLAHMAYRVEGGRLMRLSGQMPGQGGLLYFALERPAPDAPDVLFRQLVRECRARGYHGVVADLPPDCRTLAAALDGAASRSGLTLYLPEQYSGDAPQARLLVSTAVSGGSLRGRLTAAIRDYGAARVVPALERTAEDFTPPARDGSGKRLTREELSLLRGRLHPSVFWSPELCARYFTYFDAGRAHFVLFDDGETLRAKLRLAGELGLAECLAVWAELEER